MKPPAFQFYPKDLLGDAKVAAMDNRTFGAYWRLACFAWEAALPDDEGELARMVNETPKNFTKMWPRIRKCFAMTENGLVHPRLEQERVKQQLRRDKASDAGKKGAAKRWCSHSDPTVLPMAKDSPSSSSSSTKLTWLTPFGDAWKAAYGGEPAFGPLAKHLKPLVSEHGQAVLAAWQRYLAATDAQYASAARFSQTFGRWHKAKTQRLADVS